MEGRSKKSAEDQAVRGYIFSREFKNSTNIHKMLACFIYLFMFYYNHVSAILNSINNKILLPTRKIFHGYK